MGTIAHSLPQKVKPQLAVIVVSWNVCELLDTCLLSLREEIERAKIPASVWVVDNASSDQSVSMVRKKHPWVKLDICPENLGFVLGNNRILRYLSQTTMPPYVWLLNPDTVVRPGTLETLINFLENHSRAGLVTPQLLNSDGSPQSSAFRFPGLLQPLFDLGKLPQRFYYTRWNGRYPQVTTEPFRIDHPLGAAMLARGSAVCQVGLLDERFFMYCEEIDWAWRMHKAGWEVWMVPEAKIVHHGGASAGQAKPVTTAYLWESRARLYRKHRNDLIRLLVGMAVRRAFSKMKPESPEWEQAYQRVIQAWKA
ncbi:MAG: glycosyltransferase family 2 protein [Anaerolineae bacterium]|nr:glycosyltransferase family 2 protein [Anaerolineae bacterium]